MTQKINKLRIKVCHKGDEDKPDKHWWEECHWWEPHRWKTHKFSRTDPQKCGEEIVDFFNRTITSPNEQERVLITAEVIKPKKPHFKFPIGNYKRLVYLEIRTYAGTIAFGAEHYYGKLEWYPSLRSKNTTEIELLKTLSTKEATYLNKKDSAYQPNYKKGDQTYRFDSEEEIIQAGIKYFQDEIQSQRLHTLILGSMGILDPRRILVCPNKEVMNKANQLCMEFEEYNGWGCTPEDEPHVEKISNQWQNLII